MSKARLAIIGGSGFDDFQQLAHAQSVCRETPYGAHSPSILQGKLLNGSINDGLLEDIQANEVVFLPRHGANHQIPPHLVNYRANIWVLSQLGVKRILACNVVGGISESMSPGTFVVPSQIIDYTSGREHTFFDGSHQHLKHTDFTEPYSPNLRQQLLTYFRECRLPHQSSGTYGCTQGPRLETAAEVRRLRHDACDIVGMTAMPEAALARELGIDYVGLSLVVNWAAGVEKDELLMDEIVANIDMGMTELRRFLPGLVQSLDSVR